MFRFVETLKSAALTVVGIVVLFAIGYHLASVTNLIRFSPFTAAGFLQHLAPLFLVALIVERTVETFVLLKHKKLRRLRLLGSVVLGATLAIMGVRALGIFVDPGEFQDLRERQRHLFHAVDVVLTTGLIAGASNGLHQLCTGCMRKIERLEVAIRKPNVR